MGCGFLDGEVKEGVEKREIALSKLVLDVLKPHKPSIIELARLQVNLEGLKGLL